MHHRSGCRQALRNDLQTSRVVHMWPHRGKCPATRIGSIKFGRQMRSMSGSPHGPCHEQQEYDAEDNEMCGKSPPAHVADFIYARQERGECSVIPARFAEPADLLALPLEHKRKQTGSRFREPELTISKFYCDWAAARALVRSAMIFFAFSSSSLACGNSSSAFRTCGSASVWTFKPSCCPNSETNSSALMWEATQSCALLKSASVYGIFSSSRNFLKSCITASFT